MNLSSPIVRLALLAAAVYAVHKYGNADMKVAAMGVVGFVVANQIPVIQDALQTRALAAA